MKVADARSGIEQWVARAGLNNDARLRGCCSEGNSTRSIGAKRSKPTSREARYRVVIVGNPNAGKSTLFNALTRRNARVGNYPGVTVDRLVGTFETSSGESIEIVDVPGTYSLDARSPDESLAIRELLGIGGHRPPDAVVVIVDALSIQRGLYLTLQVLELGLPTVVAVNMMDSLEAEGGRLDLDVLADRLGVPVVGTVARQGEGISTLKTALERMLKDSSGPGTAVSPRRWKWTPAPVLEEALHLLDEVVKQACPHLRDEVQRRAYALWILMSTTDEPSLRPPEIRSRIRQAHTHLENAGIDLDEAVVLARYAWIDGNVPAFLTAGTASDRNAKPSLTERLDAVLTHPFWGSVVFLVVMTTMFQALFSWASPLMDGITALFGLLADETRTWLPEGIVRDLVADGMIAGVGSVVVFLPQILFLFLFITLLEGSGYMARAAFLLDRLMAKIGLHGRAFVPMMSGYACAIPGIMAVRTIESERDRLLTMMVIPLMSCSARLPVYALLIGALFPAEMQFGFVSVGTLMFFGIYLMSTISALVAASILGRTVLKGNRPPMVLELPPYRLPDLRTVARTLLGKARVFLRTAGTIILLMSIVLWVLLHFPRHPDLSMDYARLRQDAAGDPDTVAKWDALEQAETLKASYAGQLGSMIEPVIAPLGFDWKIGIGLIGAFAAREVFVSTLGIVYGVGDDVDEGSLTLRQAIRDDRRPDGRPLWTPLTGFSLMIFFMYAMQCMSTLAVVRRETGSWKWTGFMVAYMTLLAYGSSFLVYQFGRFLGFS